MKWRWVMAGLLGLLLFFAVPGILFIHMSWRYERDAKVLVGNLQEQDGDSARRVLNLFMERGADSDKAVETGILWREALHDNAYLESDWEREAREIQRKYLGIWFGVFVLFGSGTAFFIYQYRRKQEREELRLSHLLERGIPVLRRGMEEESMEGILPYEKAWEEFIVKQPEGRIRRTGEDILELIRLQYRYSEREQERKAQMQNFVENVAHQWKTPLARMSLALDMMTEQNWSQKREFCLGEIQGLHPLIERLLNVARMKSGKVSFHAAPMELTTLLQDAGRRVKDWQKFRWNWRADREEYVIEGDEVWLEQAFFNIYENAAEQMEGMEHPGIDTKMEQLENGVRVQIQDEGRGIDEERVRNLFQRFYTGEQGDGNSTGIGLHLASEVIRRHQGHISAYNGERGAVFEVFLPQYALKRK